ncbi:hypothetical protein ASPWEDRAFT_43971 [Aspergillus wentii DTO 134E9]|uniref:Protein kinase domain-containing protein n=1 Tax=Aspergillus wentii DTO 134E9 TaxID=1073089 RepID=A0A1L9RAL3_ASPWE|nr:uncharacterized protein ASPWEDRAFT_43971 [Aspergillus wentii DTO 134E9]OJJ31966.1 hypothetical protein ASPWEDRAFT_43971 [Aspergillus wentii DTO 134E9]
MALCIQNHWMRTRKQLKFIQRVSDTLDKDHRDIQNQIVRALINKLSAATTSLGKVTETYRGLGGRPEIRVEKWRYIRLKESLQQTMDDLEVWQKRFDPSWFLIMKVANPMIDLELSRDSQMQNQLPSALSVRKAATGGPQSRSSVFLDKDALESAEKIDIPYTSAKWAQRQGSAKWLVLDTMAVDPQLDISRLIQDVRDLARKLSCSDPATFGLLNCYGVIKETDPSNRRKVNSFCFVFRTPARAPQGTSLRSRLICGNTEHSLSERFRIAKEVARSVCYMHTHGFVHKNIRPETILLLQSESTGFGSSFLLGFGNFRSADGRTLQAGDSDWEKNLYRHPRRVGLVPEDEYIMQHDIYSLGVCLLEVGLWETFVLYDDQGGNPRPSPILNLELDNLEQLASIKEHLVSLTRNILPRRMGTKYARVVETCLTCLDPDNADFGDEQEFQDADGVLVAVRYIEKVLLQLDGICL